MQELFDCPVCLELLQEPLSCGACAGTVCRQCVVREGGQPGSPAPADSVFECALCRARAAFQPCRVTRRFLDSLKFRCKHAARGCAVESAHSNLQAHIASCRFRLSYEQLEALTVAQQSELEALRAELLKTKADLAEAHSKNADLTAQIRNKNKLN